MALSWAVCPVKFNAFGSIKVLSFNPSELLAHGKVGKWDGNCFDQARNGASLVSFFFHERRITH